VDTTFTPEERVFRDEVRTWIKRYWTEELANRIADKSTFKEAQTELQKLLNDQGWMAPGWPEEYGGTGWSVTRRYIYNTEMARAGVLGPADPMVFGVSMVGPVIYTYGNEEQKKRFLPKILTSDEWWCQGYSEPGSGSDLASLKTKAELEGDHYVVNGAKIWTTYAHYADWIFCLVRTDSSGRKQEGISFLLIDMKTPGIKVNPIIGIDGRHTLNETEFNNVRVPKENLIGEQDKGWTYAKSLLTHERLYVANVSQSKRSLAELKKLAEREWAGGQPLAADPYFQQRISDIEIDLMALEFTELRVLSAAAAGKEPGAESSVLKLRGSEIAKALQDIKMDVAGYYAGIDDADNNANHSFANKTRIDFMYGRASSVYGGTNEIQKNIIAKAVLGF
jgi:alkylation response protein AidB-like acyl-CoA dehydrogenase